MKINTACLAMLSILGLVGCSTEQRYSVGQAWQRNQCDRLPDRADAQRCSERGGPPYETYKREVEPQRTQ